MTPTRTLFVGIFVSLLFPATSLAVTFRDVQPSNAFYQAIESMNKQQIMTAYNRDGTFKPSQKVPRADFFTVAVRTLPLSARLTNQKFTMSGITFTDVQIGSWYLPALKVSLMKGFLPSTDKTFRPGEAIKLSEASVALVKAFSVPVNDASPASAVQALCAKGVIPGSVQSLTSSLNRGELAEMIYRLQTGTQSPGASTYSKLIGEEQIDTTGSGGSYEVFYKQIIGDGHRSLLFFYATWNSSCRGNDALLKKWYVEKHFPITTYKVDYDSEKTTRTRLDVKYANTFVLIDEKGNVLGLWKSPWEPALEQILKKG